MTPSFSLPLLKNGGADHLAEAKPDGVVKQFGYFALIEQVREILGIARIAGGIGRKVPIGLLVNASHWGRLSVPVLYATVSTALCS
jgi:hypothetical protein